MSEQKAETETAAETAGARPEADERSRWIALYVLCAGVLMIVLDVTVVNVALPTIQNNLGFSQSSLAWVVNAYLITFGGLLLLAGRFVDLIGRRTIFLAGGVLPQAIDWLLIFFIHLPIGIATAYFSIRLIDRDEGIGVDQGADIPGAVLITSSLMLGVYTIVKPAAEKGWGASETLLLG